MNRIRFQLGLGLARRTLTFHRRPPTFPSYTTVSTTVITAAPGHGLPPPPLPPLGLNDPLQQQQQQQHLVPHAPGDFHFNTWRMVAYLEAHGYARGQSVALMATMHHLLASTVRAAHADMITTLDVENETYLYKAALAELGTELRMTRQTDSAALKSELDRIARDLDHLAQRARDDISTAKSDLTIDLNNRKSEIREDGKVMEMRLQEVNNKLTVLCSDIKTDVETLKFDATKDVLVRLFFGAVLLLAVMSGINTVSGTSSSGGADNFASAPPKSKPPLRTSEPVILSSSSSSGDRGGADTVIIVDGGGKTRFDV
ncbi:hypothetical protein BC828DRAFT_364909 [Blastocladiella britannica]|nr:hypothetical protein BC828DRAFT_364909 [Blastocladiella britannica]